MGTVISSLIYSLRIKNVMTFGKADLYCLSRDIEYIKQLLKRIIRMLLFFGYIVQVGRQHYHRTYKKPPAIGLDAFQYVTELPQTSSVQSITITLTHLKSRILQKNPLDRKKASVKEEKHEERY
jgi:hypothetical protein